jgi:lysophospholipase L1-like esterase
MNYVALGDSITAYRNGVKVYFELLHEHRQELGFTEMFNEGVGGWTTAHLLANLDSKCLRHKPEIITLMLGTNDHAIYEGCDEPDVSISEFESNLCQIISNIRTYSCESGVTPKQPRLILMTPPFTATYTNVAGTQLSQSRILQYCKIVKKVSNEFLTGYVDINTLTGIETQWNDDLFCSKYTDQDDGCHLNSLGHQDIFPYIKAAILKEVDCI